jgi:ribosomal protein L11 methyltransferase
MDVSLSLSKAIRLHKLGFDRLHLTTKNVFAKHQLTLLPINMYYTQLQVVCDPAFSEILMAEIGEVGFDTFMENDQGFEAYCEGEKFNADTLTELKAKYQFVSPLNISFHKIQKQNWNEEWEKNLQPIIVDDRCLVRAEFHKIERKYPYEIIITPKMSFGTGHHQTTHLMLQAQLDIDHQDKRVIDVGCGTAILSIMASKRGARHIEAFDIDEWSVINGKENVENNACDNINIRQGKILELNLEGSFDIILANINKNVLMNDMNDYATYLTDGGLLLLSGFYDRDMEDIKNCAKPFSLVEVGRQERESWASLLLRKGKP